MPTQPTANDLRRERLAMHLALQLVTAVTVAPYLVAGSARQILSRVHRRNDADEWFEYYYQVALTRLLYHLQPLAGINSYQTDGLHPKITAVLDTVAGIGVECSDASPSTLDRPPLRDVLRTMMHAEHRTHDIQAAVEWAAVKGINATGQTPIADRLDVLGEIAYEAVYGELGEPWAIRGDLNEATPPGDNAD